MDLQDQSSTQHCIIGIGNSLRKDDGIGSYICEQLRRRHLNNASIINQVELDPALAEQIHQYKTLIIIDAAANNPSYDVRVFKPIHHGSAHEATTISSHGIEAHALISLLDTLYDSKPQVYLVAVKGYDFSLGMEPTESAIANAERAIELIIGLVQHPEAA